MEDEDGEKEFYLEFQKRKCTLGMPQGSNGKGAIYSLTLVNTLVDVRFVF